MFKRTILVDQCFECPFLLIRGLKENERCLHPSYEREIKAQGGVREENCPLNQIDSVLTFTIKERY